MKEDSLKLQIRWFSLWYFFLIFHKNGNLCVEKYVFTSSPSILFIYLFVCNKFIVVVFSFLKDVGIVS